MVKQNPMDEGQADFPDPKYASPAPPHQVVGEIVGHCARWDEDVIVKGAGDNGHTIYPDTLPRVAAVSVQGGRLLVDPTVKVQVSAEQPRIVRERLSDGCLELIEGDNYSGSFRAVTPVGPELIPPQIDLVRESIRAAKHASHL